jgi:3-hydroxyisobutyrate dehydrogenase-like beta-hydroxyacid dehydrogenase
MECADSIGYDPKAIKKCKELFEMVRDNGDGHKDCTIVYQYMRKI